MTISLSNVPQVRPGLRLRERSLTGGEACAPSSSATLSVLRKCLKRKWRSSCVGWKGNWCNNSWEEEEDTDELGALVQYPDEGTDATDHLRPSTLSPRASWLRANWKLADVLAVTFLGLSEGLLPAVASGRGESGRESVGDGVPTAKLLLLLLRELFDLFIMAPVTKLVL